MVNLIPMANDHIGLIVGCMNVRSLLNAIDLVRPTFQNSKFQILGFSETWLNQKIDSSLVHMNNYVLHRQDRNFTSSNNEIKKGGGICLYVDMNLKTKSMHLKELNISNPNIECQWLEICHDHQRNIIIGNLYRPPNGDVDKFLEYIEQCLGTMNLGNKDLIICGDVNIDVLDKANISTKKLTEFITQTGLSNYIKAPTRYSSTRNSCIDHIYSNSDIILDSGVLDVNISDHELVYIIRKRSKTVHTKGEFTGRSYIGYNQEAFFRLIDNSPWENFYENTDPNVLWNLFKNNIKRAADVLCPPKLF